MKTKTKNPFYSVSTEFVTYKQAIALKELNMRGHNSFDAYVSNGKLWGGIPINKNDINKNQKLVCLAPLKQQVFRFFRDRGIRFYITSNLSDLGVFYKVIFPDGEARSMAYDSHEKAEEYCINVLIKIFKKKK